MRPKTMKAKEYPLLEENIEQGVRWGLLHAYKHTNTPTHEGIIDSILRDIMLEIDEHWTFEDETS